ncbi:MAG: ZIP family metal transporter [Endomicrobiia bacterium]
MNFLYAILASILISIISLIGIFTFFIKENIIEKILFILISFAAGSLIGAAFLHILPEVVEKSNNTEIFYFVVLGFIIFFVLEKYFYWRHCHKGGKCELHPVSYLNLLGDGIHNFVDGVVIGASFFVDIKLGIVSTIAIVLHEIPQELGDFGVLLYGGFSKVKALFCNFLISFSAVLGSVLGFFLTTYIENIFIYLLSIIAGGFIYISACDLIPEIQRERVVEKSIISLLFFVIGIVFMGIIKH